MHSSLAGLADQRSHHCCSTLVLRIGEERFFQATVFHRLGDTDVEQTFNSNTPSRGNLLTQTLVGALTWESLPCAERMHAEPCNKLVPTHRALRRNYARTRSIDASLREDVHRRLISSNSNTVQKHKSTILKLPRTRTAISILTIYN